MRFSVDFAGARRWLCFKCNVVNVKSGRAALSSTCFYSEERDLLYFILFNLIRFNEVRPAFPGISSTVDKS